MSIKATVGFAGDLWNSTMVRVNSGTVYGRTFRFGGGRTHRGVRSNITDNTLKKAEGGGEMQG